MGALIPGVMRAAFTVVTFALATGSVHAAEPLRLQVIPFQEAGGNTQQPIHRFEGELKPPPALNMHAPRAASPPRKRQRRWTRGRDHDWLMD